MNALYIIGEPGAGKSTLAAALTKGAMGYVIRKPFAMTVWQASSFAPPVHELGIVRGDFSGTDALSMSVQPKVLRWLEMMEPRFVLGEGDRLGNASFFKAVMALGYALRVVYLVIPPEVASQRRLLRALALGRPEQNDTWVRGRRTKVERLAEAFADVTLPGTSDVSVMVEGLRNEPVVQALAGKEVATC